MNRTVRSKYNQLLVIMVSAVLMITSGCGSKEKAQRPQEEPINSMLDWDISETKAMYPTPDSLPDELREIIDFYINQYVEEEQLKISQRAAAYALSAPLPRPVPRDSAMYWTEAYMTAICTTTTNFCHANGADSTAKSVHFDYDELVNSVNRIRTHYQGTGQYQNLDDYGYRVYFANYSNWPPKKGATTLNSYSNLFTTVVRITYQNADMAYSQDYDVALNVGDICPPHCEPGNPTGVFR